MSSGHGQQRAFTQKLSKQHAADVRRNIAYSGKVNTNAYCSGWSGDVVEPLDYEDFLAQHHMLIERDPLSSILDFPVGDVEVALLERHIRTLEPVVPEEKLDDLTPHVQCCVRCFTSDWNIIKYLHRQYSSSVSAASTIKIFSLNRRQEFEIDFETSSIDIDSELSISSSTSTIGDCGGISTDTDNTLTPRNSWASFDLRNSIGEPLIPEILERISPEGIDQLNESRRQASEDRQECLFSVYNDYYKGENEEPIERRLVAEAPSEHLGHRVLVKCLQLKLEIEVEPIFATMALYDAKEKKKLSENFYFDMNSENVKRMLGGHIPFADISTLSRSCIFNITHPSPDLFIVVRLEKVLQGDINECIEPYMKDDKLNRQKVKENAVIMCDRLGKYRQAFAWTAIYLMNVINGISTLERDKDTDSISSGSSSSHLSNTNSLERKISSSGLEQLRRRATDMGSLTRRGSLERKCSEKRRSWSPDHFSNGLDTFRPLTLTVTSFFKLESERLKDEDLYKFLQELKRPCQVMKKLKCIPGFLKLDISPCPPQQQQQQQLQQQTQQQPVLSSFQNPNAIYGTLRGNQINTNTNTNTIYAQPSQLSQLVAGGSPSAIRRATTSANRSQSAERKIIGEGPGGVGSGFIAALSAKLHPSLSPRNSRRHSEDLGPQCSNISQPQPKIIQRGPGQGFLDTLNAKLAQQHLTNAQGQLKANKIRQIINSKAQPDPTTCHESLMDQIKRGATLKKARGVNDRSAPKIY